MNNKLFAALLLVTKIAAANEVCEMGTIASNLDTEQGGREVATMNCTDWKVFGDMKIFYHGFFGVGTFIAESDRIVVKKALLNAGYHATPECSAYETYIKP